LAKMKVNFSRGKTLKRLRVRVSIISHMSYITEKILKQMMFYSIVTVYWSCGEYMDFRVG